MISQVSELLRAEVNSFIRQRAQLTGDQARVELTHFEREGKLAIKASTVGMCIFNLDEERVMKTPGLAATRVGDRITYVQPEVRLNLYILFAANFGDYLESLKHIGWITGFFQGKRVFEASNSPSAPAGLEPLAVDMYPMSLEQQNYLWSILGVHYLPSVAYQVRPVVIQENRAEFEQRPVLETDIRLSSTTNG